MVVHDAFPCPMPFWIYLVVAVLVGAVPARWLWDGRMIFVDGNQFCTRIVMHNPGDNRRRRRWWKSKVIWVDPIRGAAAGWGLAQGGNLWAESVGFPFAKYIVYGGLALLVLLVAGQTLGREKEKECIVPVLFVAGVIGGYFGWLFGLSFLAIGILALMGTQSLAFMLFAMVGTLAIMGGFMLGVGANLLFALCLPGIPLVRMILLNHKLVLAIRG